MLELPYGIADFHTIRTQGMVYVDRTAHIRDIERLGRVLVFLRPRRFGKSLWLQTLANYYDIHRGAEFEQLFSGLAIGREPTPLHNRYFVMQWNLSEVSARGDASEIGRRLNLYINDRIEDFLAQYKSDLPGPVAISEVATNSMRHVLSAISRTPYKLYLLIDEYDNFTNEVMVEAPDTYRALVDTDGPFKTLFKSVKSALEGQGLERVFVTGVSPVALNDMTSGFNNAKNVSLSARLGSLCGFLESDIRDLLQHISDEQRISAEAVAETVATMRTWYNGYRFTEAQQELVYNPTNTLYFLDHLYLEGKPPGELHDQNLRADHAKLGFLARTSAGAGVIEQLTEGDEAKVAISRLKTSFSLDELTTRIRKDRAAVASLMYYMGLLTLTGDAPPQLKVPNLVVRKLFLDRLLEIHLPDPGDSSAAQEIALAFFQSGDLAPLLAFFETKLLPVLSNRDRGAAPRRPGLSGSGVNETVIKTLFLSMLFDDTRYVTFSEPEIEHGYADLCLIVRPEMRQHGFFDLLFELKLVRRRELGKKGQELAEMDEENLRQLPPVAAALDEARQQVQGYRQALVRRFGEPPLRIRCYVVVAIGLERMLGELVP
jgi:DNA-binding Xre family transcriptional regulator